MLSYRLFQLRLLVHLVSVIFQNGLHSLKKRASFIVIALLFAMSVGLLLNSVADNPVVQVEDTVTAAPQPIYIAAVNEETLTTSEVNTRLKKTELLLQKQPTHFDLLINAALLHQTLGNEDKAQNYFAEAKAVHPNHPIFE